VIFQKKFNYTCNENILKKLKGYSKSEFEIIIDKKGLEIFG